VKIARTKLRHDLFDRRFKVFEAARDFLFKVMSRGNAANDEVRDYTLGVIDAQFLLSADVRDYLYKIRRRAINLQSLKATLEPLPTGMKKRV
jgi:hypothetical protein